MHEKFLWLKEKFLSLSLHNKISSLSLVFPKVWGFSRVYLTKILCFKCVLQSADILIFPLLNVLYKQYISLQDSSIEWLINVLDCGLLLRPDIDGL